MKTITYILFLSVAFTASFCVQPPDYPETPVLEYIGFNKLTVAQGGGVLGNDTLVLTIGFTDGDGDLGYEDGTVDIYITDSRDSFSEVRKLPVIPEQGVGNGISGEICLVFPNEPFNICCIYPDLTPGCQPNEDFPTDSLSYEVYIIDRAGNQSNIIRTETVTLLCN
jgi:hypothetical protein